jgi:predicted Zn-dependent peptidase
MSRRRLLGYFQGAYRPQALLVAAAGHLRHDAVARFVRATFGRMPRTRGRRRPTAPPRTRGGIVRAAKRGLEQVHLVLGVPALPEAHAARHRLLVLNAVLGGTTSSRLFQKVREERGLAYAVESSVQSYHDAGQLVVYAATSPGRTGAALRVILDEMRDLKERGPSPEELRVARSHLEGSLLLSQESTSSRMWSLARQEIVHGAQATVAETLRDLAKVTPRGVRDLARVLFRDRGLGLAAVGRPGGLRVPSGGLSL